MFFDVENRLDYLTESGDMSLRLKTGIVGELTRWFLVHVNMVMRTRVIPDADLLM